MSSEYHVRVSVDLTYRLHDRPRVRALVVRAAGSIAARSTKTVSRLIGDEHGNTLRYSWGDSSPYVATFRISVGKHENRLLGSTCESVPSGGFAIVDTHIRAAIGRDEIMGELVALAVIAT